MWEGEKKRILRNIKWMKWMILCKAQLNIMHIVSHHDHHPSPFLFGSYNIIMQMKWEYLFDEACASVKYIKALGKGRKRRWVVQQWRRWKYGYVNWMTWRLHVNNNEVEMVEGEFLFMSMVNVVKVKWRWSQWMSKMGRMSGGVETGNLCVDF